MQLRQLEYFRALAEQRNFHAAARRLGISQPTLSQQLQTLERECGVLLVARDRHNVELTEAGLTLLVRARRILNGVEAAQAELRELATAGARLTIGTFGASRVTRFLAEFTKQHPDVDVVVHQHSYQQARQLLAEQQLDLALMQLHPTASRVPSGIGVTRLAPLAVGLLMRPDHALANEAAVSLAELLRERLILTSFMSAPRLAFELVMKQAGLEPDRQPFLVTASSTMASMVAEGLGVGVVAGVALSFEGRELLFRELRHPDLACYIGLGWARKAPRSTAAEAFIRFAETWPWPPLDDRLTGYVTLSASEESAPRQATDASPDAQHDM